MITIKVDATGLYWLRWPALTRQDEVLALARAYVAYEGSLPEGERVLTPALGLIEGVLAAAQQEQSTARHAETTRATAAETYRQTFAAAKPQLNIALLQLKARYAANLAQLEAWGLDTVVLGSSISVRKPRTEREWAQFLARYVAQETNLDAASRLPQPALTEMTTLSDTLQAADAARKAAQSQREAAVETRKKLVNRLLDLLQGAALGIVLTQFEGQVTNDLQRWGFEVVGRRARETFILHNS